MSDPPSDPPHGPAAHAAAAYQSHAPGAEPHPHPHVVIEVGDDAPPPPPRQEPSPPPRHDAPAPQVLVHRLDAPFRTAFAVGLGWTASRVLFRLGLFVVVFGVLALWLWHVLGGL